jgi:DNA invertase Pin-like site-specific DNA recombinase
VNLLKGDLETKKEFVSYVRVSAESGNSIHNRPMLREAISFCEKHRVVLAVAKLDRLARSVSFISALMDSKVEFVVCDFPEANRLALHILAAVAEHEREMISKRTKEALQAAKARGVKLGNPNLQADNQRRIERANAFAEGLRRTLEAFKAQGYSQEQMIAELNKMGVRTPRGGKWNSCTQLRNVLKRIA